MNLAKYLKVFTVGLQNTFVYRWNFLFRMLCGIVPLIGTYYIWGAIFQGGSGNIGGYEFRSMICYFLLVVFIENLITPTEDEWQIASDIRDGRISAILVKPMNYLLYRLNLYASYRLLYVAVIIIPAIGLGWVLRDYLIWPESWITWPIAAWSILMAGLIQFFIAYSLAMLAFWILEISTVIFIVYAFEYFLSGRVFPLDLMPGWLAGFVRWSPFTYELFFPVQVLLERVKGPELVFGLCVQAGWVGLTFLAARGMWALGTRHYQAVGG